MKFGKQLQLGTYEPWKEHYIQYSKLKRIIKRRRFVFDKQLEKQSKLTSASRNTSVDFAPLSMDSENTPLNKSHDISKSANNNWNPSLINIPISISTITNAIKRVTSSSAIQTTQDNENRDDSIEFFPAIIEEINKVNNFFVGKIAELRIELDEITSTRRNAYRTHHTGGDSSSSLLRLRDIYVQLAALRSFCTLNHTGFYKIIKKYDKIMEENTLESWMVTVKRQAFSTAVESNEPLQLMDIVTSLVSRDKLIEWERFATEQQNKINDDIFPSVRFFGLTISIIIFAISLFFPLITPNDPQASRCLSLLLLTISLWITEAIPYFATALLIPALVTFLGVLKDPLDKTKSMTPDLAAAFVLNHIFNHTTMLLLGGFTISTAFSRCQLELRLASYMQKQFGGSPSVFILAVMFLGLFLSMWINNHTAPILCATIILPIVRDLPTDSRFSKALLLGLAYACNFGGMMTPISSLQNVLAVTYLEQSGIEVSFGRWMCVSLPFCIVGVLVSWVIIILIVKPDDIKIIPVIPYERGVNVFGKRNLAVITLTLLTMLLFAFFSYTQFIFGDIGIVSLCFVSVMYGSGILSEVDFNSLSWHTLFLVGGGNVLGKAAESSGLLAYLSDGILR
eukprot:gene9656-12998_t